MQKKATLSLSVSNLSFINFNTEANGSCFSVSNIESVVVTNVKFISSSASYGGSVFAENVNSVVITDSTFLNNYAENGGALALFFVSSFSNVNSIFYYCEAANIGGALLLDSVNTAFIQNSKFKYNFAINFGGAISFSSISTELTVQYNTFKNCSAKWGSAFVVTDTPYIDIYRNIFISNYATIAGCVYWLASTMNEPKNLMNNFYRNNAAGSYGGNYATNIAFLKYVGNGLNITSYAEPYPLTISINVADYYGNTLYTENGAIVTFQIASDRDVHCNFNAGRAELIGNSVSILHDGVAKFTSIGGICIPGGHIDATFTIGIDSSSSNYPIYTTTTVSIKAKKSLKFVSLVVPVYFRHCHVGEKYDFFSKSRSSCSSCVNSFSLADNFDNSVINCIPCPALAAQCYGNQIILPSGYWRWADNAVTILPCPLAGGCMGGNVTGQALCSSGHGGPLCGICKDGYYKGSDSCLSCTGATYSVGTVVIISFFAFVACATCLYYLLKAIIDKNNSMFKFIEVFIAGVNEEIDGSTEIVRQKQRRNNALIVRLKIVISTLQIVTQCPRLFAVNMPPIFSSFVKMFAFLSLDVSSVLPIGCFVSYTALKNLYVMTILPFGAFATIFLLYCISGIYIVIVYYSRQNLRDGMLDMIKLRYFGVFLMISYFILPGVSLIIFNSFSCVDVDPSNDDITQLLKSHYLLRDDYSIDCNSSLYVSFGRPWAVISLFAYPIGLPLVYLTLLYKNKAAITYRKELKLMNKSILLNKSRKRKYKKEKAHQVDGLAFIFLSYNPKYWYWEIVEVSRRLALTAGLQAIFNGSLTQVIISLIVALFYMQLYTYIQPFDESIDNFLAEIGQFQIFFTYFAIWITMQDSIKDIPAGYNLLDYLLIFVNVGFLVIIVFIAVMEYRQVFERQNKMKLNYENIFIKKKALDLSNFFDKVKFGEYLYGAATTEDVFNIQSLVAANIILRSRASTVKYVYYIPASKADAAKRREHFEYWDIESNVVYLKLLSEDVELFTFLVPLFERISSHNHRHQHKRLISKYVYLPSEAFIIRNYKMKGQHVLQSPLKQIYIKDAGSKRKNFTNEASRVTDIGINSKTPDKVDLNETGTKQKITQISIQSDVDCDVDNNYSKNIGTGQDKSYLQLLAHSHPHVLEDFSQNSRSSDESSLDEESKLEAIRRKGEAQLRKVKMAQEKILQAANISSKRFQLRKEPQESLAIGGHAVHSKDLKPNESYSSFNDGSKLNSTVVELNDDSISRLSLGESVESTTLDVFDDHYNFGEDLGKANMTLSGELVGSTALDAVDGSDNFDEELRKAKITGEAQLKKLKIVQDMIYEEAKLSLMAKQNRR